MLTKVEVYSENPGVSMLSLDLLDPSDDQIQIRDIDGLGPVKADIVSLQYSDDGELYQSSSKGKRNIVFKFGLNPDWGIQSMGTLRHILYDYFTTESRVVLRFFSDNIPTVEIVGYVETFEPNIFAKDPEIQISVLCPNPDFVDINVTTITGTIHPNMTDLAVEYVGTVETGFEMDIDIKTQSEMETYGIYVTHAGVEQPFVAYIYNPDSAYYFYLSTLRGYKRAQKILIADGTRYNNIQYMIDIAVFPLFKPGTNYLTTRLEVAPLNQEQRNWTLTYRNRFGGL